MRPHAFFLTADEDRDGRVDRITVVARGGFGDDDVAALADVRQFAVGQLRLRAETVRIGQAGDFRSPLLDPARESVSATPFLVSRWGPARRANFVCAVAGDEWERHWREASIASDPDELPYRPAIEWIDASASSATIGKFRP